MTNGLTSSQRVGAERTASRSPSTTSPCRTFLHAPPPQASAGSGHDPFGFNGAGGARLYRKFSIDVSDLVKEMEKQYGEVSVFGKQGGAPPSHERDVELSAEVIPQGGQFKLRSMLADATSVPTGG